jgi:hypothetical protein
MNLDKLNKWLMLAANLGVLAGIVFLALEIRQNSDALVSESRQGLLEADLAILDNYFDYPEVYGLGRGKPDMDETALRLEINYISILRSREFAWQQYRRGLVDEETFLSYLAPSIGLLSTATGRDFIEQGRYTGDPAFIEYLKARLAEAAE